MSFPDDLAKHRRITILRFLMDSPSYTSNSSILTDTCNGLGVATSRAQMHGEIAWLEENSFVTSEGEQGFQVVKITDRGLDIAKGISFHPDIKRPRP